MMRAKKVSPKPEHMFYGRTNAYRNFSDEIWKTRKLLEYGLSGITGNIKELDALIEKLRVAKGTRGRIPKDYKPDIKAVKTNENEEMQISLDSRTAFMARKMLETSRGHDSALRFHFYAILAVSIWGAFETYLVMLFEELYETRPELLKSEESVTYKDAIDHRDNILGLIIERQLDKIGHFTLREMLKHLNNKINFNFSEAKQTTLSNFYLIRNIIAHNSGIVQGSIVAKLPQTILVKDKRIQITKAYLEGMLKTTEKNVRDIEKYVSAKFFKDKAI
jgi:hypothetical protein